MGRTQALGGVFLIYRRNQATLVASKPVSPLAAEEFLKGPSEYLGGRLGGVHLDGHELVRGRGGLGA